MALPDQIQARAAAHEIYRGSSGARPTDGRGGFRGHPLVKQNFTANADLLTAAVSGVKHANIETNGQSADMANPVMVCFFRLVFDQQRRSGFRRAHDAAGPFAAWRKICAPFPGAKC